MTIDPTFLRAIAESQPILSGLTGWKVTTSIDDKAVAVVYEAPDGGATGTTMRYVDGSAELDEQRLSRAAFDTARLEYVKRLEARCGI